MDVTQMQGCVKQACMRGDGGDHGGDGDGHHHHHCHEIPPAVHACIDTFLDGLTPGQDPTQAEIDQLIACVESAFFGDGGTVSDGGMGCGQGDDDDGDGGDDDHHHHPPMDGGWGWP